MNIEQIESNLASLFDPDNNLKPRQLVFWYDPKEDFGEALAELTLPDDLEKLTLGDTPFTITYKLLIEAPTSSFLLYAPFAEPVPQENWLLDLQKQGENPQPARRAPERKCHEDRAPPEDASSSRAGVLSQSRVTSSP